MARHKPPEELRLSIRRHFDAIAPDYDRYKQHSAYYYDQLKQLLKELIGSYSEKRILEIGCGTGSLLADLNPVAGLGIDVSEKMIGIAVERWRKRPELRFLVGEAETLEVEDVWDVVLMCDVLEHLYDPNRAIARLRDHFNPGTRMIVTWANSLWEPILYILEKCHLKMPEGDHNWEPVGNIIKKFEEHGFNVIHTGTRCLIPAGIPLADSVNRHFINVPILKSLGLIRFIVAEKTA
ncbi:class I SAM-dependent methyltransferase [bacterium]|nr:class I SAM-dependent methyltransferase [candidate division CSSED10-310 bacterium]